MKFLTDKEIIAKWFASSGRFGPADDVVEFAREIERMVAKEVLANAKDSLKWMTVKEKAT